MIICQNKKHKFIQEIVEDISEKVFQLVLREDQDKVEFNSQCGVCGNTFDNEEAVS